MDRYQDRTHAGRVLAAALAPFAKDPRVIVLALPRGGVPVAYEVARRLGAPLDVFIVRKLGAPGEPELAMGAVASGGARVLNEDVVSALGIREDQIAEVAEEEERELARRERAYRPGRPPIDVRGRTVILVDDGLATGATMRAAVAGIRQLGPRALIVAVPVGAEETCDLLEPTVDALVCPLRPERFHAVGLWYETFGQTSDEEVRDLLQAAWRGGEEGAAAPAP